ncbi:hypothetical protein Gogos_000735 [Gossypium gossypioides]|uniref:Retrotransposon gag domain-containing protein n=1 Tax=Gossypium gossypioides TaxID=34282 RepID=A0A7J9CU03_GOSGO|nr:hypothetical protein [Gossypium gossypioides]
MSKEEFEQRWARKSYREMLSVVKEFVGKLEEPIEDTKESDNAFGESIDDLRKQSRDFVTMCLTSLRDSMQELLDSQRKKLTERNDALEAMVKALKEETMATIMALSTIIEELKKKLALFRVAVGKGVSSAALSYEDRMENYFRAKGLTDDVVKVNIASMFLTDIALLWWRGRTTGKGQGEIGIWQEFQCELKGQFYP